MIRSKLFSTAICLGTALVAASASTSAHAQFVDSSHPENAESEENTSAKGIADTATRWTYRQVPVCWENPRRGEHRQRNLVQQAIADTWEHYADIEFVGWDTCEPESEGIRIYVADAHPHVKGLGNRIAGVPQGMVLNFDFESWGESCLSDKDFCIRSIAVHEFGHALGLAHEQARLDTPQDCLDDVRGINSGSTSGDLYIGPWDLDSIMNYCNPKWNNHGILSKTDEIAARTLYPSHPIKLLAQARRRRSTPMDEGYYSIGDWHADQGGVVDSNWNWGRSKATLVIDPLTLADVAEIYTTVNDNGQTPMPPDDDSDWTFVGYWDVDHGGGQDSFGNWGHWNMGMFIRLRQHPWDYSLRQIKLVASNDPWAAYEIGYSREGHWDVSRRGSNGTDGSQGKWMMTMLTRWSVGYP